MSTLTQFMGGSGGSGLKRQLVYMNTNIWTSPVTGKVLFTLVGGGGGGGSAMTQYSHTYASRYASGGGAGALTRILSSVTKGNIFYLECGGGGTGGTIVQPSGVHSYVNGSAGGITRLRTNSSSGTILGFANGGLGGLANSVAVNGVSGGSASTISGDVIESFPGGGSGNTTSGYIRTRASGGGSVGIFSPGLTSDNVNFDFPGIYDTFGAVSYGGNTREFYYGMSTLTSRIELNNKGLVENYSGDIFHQSFPVGFGGISSYISLLDPMCHGGFFAGGSGGIINTYAGIPTTYFMPPGVGGVFGGGGGGFAQVGSSMQTGGSVIHRIRPDGGIGGIIIEYFVNM